MQFIEAHRGYWLCQPTSGGKAGKNQNVTSSVQVRKQGTILFQTRYNVDSRKSYREALSRARLWINKQYRQ